MVGVERIVGTDSTPAVGSGVAEESYNAVGRVYDYMIPN